MTSAQRLRTRVTVALILILSLVVTACGTRLDREAIMASAYGTGTTAGPGGQEGVPGELGEGGLPGAPDAGTGGQANGDAGPVDGANQHSDSGKTASGSGKTGSPGGSARPKDSSGGGGGPIVIASVGSYSGPAGAAWGAGAQGLKVWASHVNSKGGINGRKVEVIVYDDGGDGAKARSQAQDAVENRKAVALVGSMSHVTIKQQQSYAEKKKIPMIGGGCDGDHWHQSPLLFGQCASSDSSIYSVVAVGGKLGKGKKWGALVCQESATCSQGEDLWFNKGYAEKAGLKPVYRAKISIAQPDFTSECIGARNAGVEILTVLGDPNTLARVGASCRRQNYNPQYLQPSGTVASKTPAQPGLADVLVSSPVFPFTGLKTPASKEFQAAWARYAGGKQLSGGAPLGWTAGKLFERAATKARANVAPAGLIKALNTLQNERLGGLTAPLTYPAGRPASDSKCWFVMRTNNGAWAAPQGDKLMCR